MLTHPKLCSQLKWFGENKKKNCIENLHKSMNMDQNTEFKVVVQHLMLSIFE
jgi:hypothetical protein